MKDRISPTRWTRVWTEGLKDGKHGYPTFLAEVGRGFRQARRTVDDSCGALMTLSLMVDAFLRSQPDFREEFEKSIFDPNNSELVITFGNPASLCVRAIDDGFPAVLAGRPVKDPVLQVKIGEGEFQLMPAEQARRLVAAWLGALRELVEPR